MTKHQERALFLSLLVLLLCGIVGLVLTGGSSPTGAVTVKQQGKNDQQPIIDQRPLVTARNLAGLAVTPEERRLADESLRLGDHAVDLAFNTALRDAAAHPQPQPPETRELNARVKKLEGRVKTQQATVNRLTTLANSGQPEDEQRLDLAQAQLALDQDELDDAKQDLARAGGDAQSKIQRMLDEHEASQHPHAPTAETSSTEVSKSAPGANSPSATQQAASPELNSLVAQLRAWGELRQDREQLRQAQEEASAAAVALARRHEQLEAEVQKEKPPTEKPESPVESKLPEKSKADASQALATIRHLSEDQKTLVEFDKRADDEKELSEVYGAWLQSARVRQQAALHGIIQSLVWILFIVLVVLIVNQLINHFFSDLPTHHKRLLHLRVVLRFAAQAVGLLAIVLVVFGRPGQISTIVGLAGAGLTVALKDFIVAFFGWFVLMGRNGLRVGDWVEINGVGGEVVDIGLLRTVLLETGNWADSGHPTGRKVTFVNSFAIEGHFFNFTTSGQWLWDELEVAIPSGENPYLMVEQIQKIVLAETEKNSQLAEQEWQRAARRYGSHFSALPAIDIRPSGSGVAVMIRYITRAHERYEVRSRLYQAIVELLHRKHVPPPSKSLAAGDGR